jgi:hypothetical protein
VLVLRFLNWYCNKAHDFLGGGAKKKPVLKAVST